MASFIERFEQLKGEKGIKTDKELVSAGLINKNSPTNWRKGMKPQPATVLVLANYFGVTVDYLLGKSDQRTAPTEELEGVDFALSGEIREMSENEKQDLLDYIRFKKSQRGKRYDT